jgi:hypothetical protein
LVLGFYLSKYLLSGHLLCKRKEMKKGLLFFTLLISCASFGQPVIKLYGYSQVRTPGMVRERDPANPSKQTANAAIAYYLYFASPASAQVRPADLWIRGKAYSITQADIIASPVRSPAGEVLVAKTSLRVRELKYDKESSIQKLLPSWLRKMIKENDLVISYFWKGKKYYKALKKIKELEIVFGE